jgi:hypothetical protein
MRITETKGAEGWREIGIYGDNAKLVAVISRPVTGADWFLHWADSFAKDRFKTKKAAIEAATKKV